MSKNFQDLTKRIVVSIISIAVIAFFLIFYHHPLIHLVLIFLVATLAGIGVWECTYMMRKKGLKPWTGFFVCFGIAEVLAFSASSVWPTFQKAPFAVFVVGAFILFMYYFNKIKDGISNVSTGFFSICYVAIPFGLSIHILYPPDSLLKLFDGRMWIIYLISVTKITDIAAYFGGRLCGKKKLIPKLSPGKTVAGTVIGFIFAILLSLCFAAFSQYYFWSGFELSYGFAVILGILIGAIGQIGDLAESLLKRDAGVKDSNRLPGLGGVLDLVDSLFFTIPLIYFVMLWT